MTTPRPDIGLIIVGDEILSGKRADKHLPKLIELLTARGLQLGWAEYVGDNPDRITATLQRAFPRSHSSRAVASSTGRVQGGAVLSAGRPGTGNCRADAVRGRRHRLRAGQVTAGRLGEEGRRRPVTLIWGGRNAASLYLMSPVERWKKVLPGFNFVPAVEDAVDAEALGGFHGRVDDAVRAHCPTLAGHEAYCCGAPPIVAAVKKACVEERGLDPKHFFSDVFVPGPAA